MDCFEQPPGVGRAAKQISRLLKRLVFFERKHDHGLIAFKEVRILGRDECSEYIDGDFPRLLKSLSNSTVSKAQNITNIADNIPTASASFEGSTYLFYNTTASSSESDWVLM